MPTKYTEFHCLGTDLLTQLTTAILLSSDWSRPNAVGLPTLFKATTTAGVPMVLDLAAIAPTVSQLQMSYFRNHDGTTPTDAVTRYLRYKSGATGTMATNFYHGIVSVGKDHLFISIEGPRIGEANPDIAAAGSVRNYIFMSALLPYFPLTDTVPTVVSFGRLASAAGASWLNDGYVFAHRNAANTISWSPGKILTMDWPAGNSGIHMNSRLDAALDGGDQQHWPYVYVDNIDGLRGRLSSFHFMGYNWASTLDVPVPQENEIVTIDGVEYKALPVTKSDANQVTYGAFGGITNNGASVSHISPVVAIPWAA